MFAACTTSAARRGGRAEAEADTERKEGEEKENGCRAGGAQPGRSTASVLIASVLNASVLNASVLNASVLTASVLTASVLTGSPSRIGPAVRVRAEAGEAAPLQLAINIKLYKYKLKF